MRNVKYIAVHCSATPQTTSIDSIKNYWKTNLGWRMPGYHFIIKPDGELIELLPIENVSNGVRGFNQETINICYLGGVDSNGKPIDNRTDAQKKTLSFILKKQKQRFPKAVIKGHRDFPNVKKACPSFDAPKEYETI